MASHLNLDLYIALSHALKASSDLNCAQYSQSTALPGCLNAFIDGARENLESALDALARYEAAMANNRSIA